MTTELLNLVDAIRAYARHEPMCKAWLYPGLGQCGCGLADVLQLAKDLAARLSPDHPSGSHAQQLSTEGSATAAPDDRGVMESTTKPINLSDDELLRMWRSVQGPHAGLTGPLIRFAGLVYAAASAHAEPLSLDEMKQAALVELHRRAKAIVAENIEEDDGRLSCRVCENDTADLHAPECPILKLTHALGTYEPAAPAEPREGWKYTREEYERRAGLLADGIPLDPAILKERVTVAIRILRDAAKHAPPAPPEDRS